MLDFNSYLKKALKKYRALLKKYLPADAYQEKLEQLELTPRALKVENSKKLYSAGHSVLEDLEKWLRQAVTLPTWHSGLEKFYQDLKDFLQDYQVQDQQVVHLPRQLSTTMVAIVQLCALPEERLTPQVAAQLTEQVLFVRTHGTLEQKKLLDVALQRQNERNAHFFSPLLESSDDFVQNTGGEKEKLAMAGAE